MIDQSISKQVYITLHPFSIFLGGFIVACWLGIAWAVVEYNRQDTGTSSIIKAIQSDDSRLVTVTFADGSKILRIPEEASTPLVKRK